ncbi:hypothetical protein HPB47_021640, partial [Ixodes persulcatus]
VPAGHVLDSDTESEPETLDSDAISSFGHSTASTSCQRATQGAPGPLGGKKVQQRPVWKTVNTSTTCVDFKGSEDLPQCILNMETPYEFFKYYCTSSLTELIVEQSNLYSVQHSPNSPLSMSEEELEQFIGILFHMSITQLPGSRYYWTKEFNIPNVSTVMTCKRFEEIKGNLHFKDNTSIPIENSDALAKLRPFLTEVLKPMRDVPKEEHLTVDEQIIPFTGRHRIKQYLPKKPRKWGYKVYVLSGVSGLCYSFEIFTGRKDNVLLNGEDDCGASSNVVMRLAREVPDGISLKERATLSLCLFKAQVAEALCKAGKADRPKRGRPSKEVEARFEAKKHRGPAKPLPCKDARLDGISHLPIMTAQRGRCKMPDCQGTSLTTDDYLFPEVIK